MNKPCFVNDLDWDLLTKKYKNVRPIIRKLKKDYPVQYLIGNVDFYGYKINVNKHVLIPRFETETLVEKTINYLKEYNLTDVDVLEIGTGSGCIPIVLKSKLPDLRITSIDKSKSALKVAKKNIKLNKLKDITLINMNVFKYRPINNYSVIISNPPYISKNIKIDPKCKYEPSTAIYAKNNGLIFYEYIIKESLKYTTEKCILAFEIGEEQGRYLKKYSRVYYPDAKVKIEKDLSGRDRYLFIINE